jgi:hypothetical protein
MYHIKTNQHKDDSRVQRTSEFPGVRNPEKEVDGIDDRGGGSAASSAQAAE